MAKQPSVEIVPAEQKAVGGGLEGAERTTREMWRWDPAIISPDRQINPNKEMADARALDSVQNDGFAMGAIATHRDSIVGSQFRLNAQPNIDILRAYNKGFDEKWLEDFQTQTEARFNLLADSQRCWFDASRTNTFTNLIRMAVVGEIITGEVLATVEWIREAQRPFRTAIQMVSPSRLSNPDNTADTRYLRRGVVKDRFGRPLGYHIRASHPTDFYNDLEVNRWVYVPREKPWGRLQVIHIVQQMRPDQTRGISDMVAALKNMKMTRQFRDVVLQNAVVNASYAAAIESELPREMVFGALGAGQPGFGEMLSTFMTSLQQYLSGSANIAIDGVKIPHLFPGTKLNLQPMGTPGGIGTDFEESLLRHTAAALSLSYEEFSRDFTKTNYSSARASMGQTDRHMQARKKAVADSKAKSVYTLWLEEDINAGNVPLPSGVGPEVFYDPVMQEALCHCTWIGAGRGQIDEKKETESAILRIQNNLSTLEQECARLGSDFRTVLRQRYREQQMLKQYELLPQPTQQMGQNRGNDSTDSTDQNGESNV